MPERPDFWGITASWGPPLIYAALVGSALYMVLRIAYDARMWWRVGRPIMRWDRPWTRLWNVFKYYFGQAKVVAQVYPGVMHVAIFSSMVIFFLGTALATISSHFVKILVGNFYLGYKLVLDLFIPIFIVGVLLAAYRRYVVRPKQLTLTPKFNWTLALLTVIVLLGPFIESFRLAIEKPDWAAWSPVGWAIARLWLSLGATVAGLHTAHIMFYSLHVLAVVALFITLPYGTLLHVITNALNIFFARLDRPVGQLAAVTTTEGGAYIFADKLKNLTWKQLLEGDACTECGRCQDVCPASVSDRPLSPKQLILSIRDAYHTERARLLKGAPEAKPLVGERVKDEVLWSCMTCGACVQECPVLIEHVDTIVDLRRSLVNEGRVDEMLQDVLANLGRYGNSFGQSDRARAKWAQLCTPKIKDARREEVEYLWFVGDFASFNPTVLDATHMTAEIFQQAGVDFGILYESERNAGNDVRRVGEEGLFEILMEKNIAALGKSKFQAIVTTDPHTYNTLKNEYPKEALNGRPILHYSELLLRLITSGRLKLSKRLGYKVTYHDPCYLGRYNQIYDVPRQVITATGCDLVEMPRNRARSYCCNAGGGLIWMKEGEMTERPSESRIHEAAALDGVNLFIVACPKDLTMYRDAVKTTSQEGRLTVKDLIELVYEAL